MTKVLVVEDEPLVRELVTEILAEGGYVVESVADAETGFEVAEENGIDLVLSDIALPGNSGLELLSHIRARRPSLPVVLMTAGISLANLSQALAGGADGLITKPFSHNELRAAIATALDRARRSERELSERLLTPTLASVLANAIEARDGEARGHCERIAKLASRLATEVGLGDAEAEVARFGGILHDIGKIGIPDRVVLKGGTLTLEELALMRTHPLVGFRLLEPLDLPEGVGVAILHHHERWDGGGYPDGLAGDDIPVVARIVALADAVESMSARRAHRDALKHQEIVEELLEGRGSQWDPDLTDQVIELIRSGQVRFAQHGFDVDQARETAPERPSFPVLLVEDDPSHALLATEALNSGLENVKVVHAPDLATATELSRGATWSLALVDHQLPDGTGMELLEELRSASPDLPIVMMTGSESLAVEAFRKGASDYVVKKPGYLDELTGRVRLLMEAA